MENMILCFSWNKIMFYFNRMHTKAKEGFRPLNWYGLTEYD